MKRIATLTMNPAIDVAYEADRVFHTHKIRARQEHYDPGGGGINVARVIARLGGTARAHYLAGGATGATLDSLLDLHQMVRSRIPIQGNTRISTAVYERETGKEFRFVPHGPVVTEQEWQACLDHLDGIECDYLVASGSLPPGVPDDFYSRLQAKTRTRGIELILDSSGAALQQGLAAGGILLVKPSLGELRQLIGRPLAGRHEIAAAALDIVNKDQAKYVAVTMGREGALLAQRSGVLWLPAVPVEAKSAVGAGDSFLAAMTFALACDRNPIDAFRYGIAAGAAAVLTPGTDLCHRDEVERLYLIVDPGETPAQASTNTAAPGRRIAEPHRA
ncbi:Putative ATP-dependent 6-phosphofructokinase isozyme 2 [Sphingobium sp. AntQ-1]|uniref:1-phosphofructokinase family hexose kinase n=1 Tax=Sphingobium sp. AntQ-1 TaxID=2930091 RepID=UPI00234ED8A1|nr:1-phosphofructokinase family hexose kinase [Sphingobium sp. AntQ-1]WCP12084.1 Putative ATP-dependent 6-phosphofructokinase isozyme 2 [Sphingobium sp. AntQ-1]